MTENKEKPLTGKQKAWLNDYLINGFNAYKATVKAGYKGNNATLRTIGSQNLTKLNIKTEIERRQAELALRTGYTTEKQVERYNDLYLVCREEHRLESARGCLDSITRMNGGFTDKLITEDHTKQVELDDKQQEEACRLANIRLAEIA